MRNMRVLVVDDDEVQLRNLCALIGGWGFQTESAQDGVAALEKIAQFQPTVLVTDLKMPRMDGFELLRRLKKEPNRLASIVLTAFGSLDLAISTVHDLGAFWFLERPVEPKALQLLLERASAQASLQNETDRLHRMMSYSGVLDEMTGVSASMKEVFSLIQQVAPTTAGVLVTGESGTGKELVARALHRLSARRDCPFLGINCAALPDALIESELFGHERGAFTGALETRLGCFELAHRGTLLLDEIGEMPLATQGKLLRVLEDSRVRRLGGKAEREVDVRIVAATNNLLEAGVNAGTFRRDLFYRLNVFRIQLPPLRERMDDLLPLIDTLIPRLNRKHSTSVVGVSPEVIQRFEGHSWPGNIRELRNVLERSTVLAGTGTIQIQHLPRELDPRGHKAPESPAEFRFEPGMTMNDAERQIILSTLRHAQNNKKKTAEILGISLRTLVTRLKEYRTPNAEE